MTIAPVFSLAEYRSNYARALILAVVNLPPRRVAGFKSEVLVLAAVCDNQGTILV
ncbi:hypothetical protein [Xenorhabdus koppenhoeferi]|uniref:hypothetical protein n=1 Tax=Xenorhabdus koppenhoeferi TaxID=351659 RepID=UPI000A9AB262|nr:hypothetical protein [Xenorhabdus koppenhoeferi]